MKPDVPSPDARLAARMRRPQRHRLLHGYPMRPLMQPVLGRVATPPFDPTRPLILGVLPHASCNPAVRGCGFCTFPHEAFRAEAVREVTARVGDEVDAVLARWPALASRRIHGLYFGGGTANLTPPDAFEALCARLASRFDLREAEVTLEGVPAYFSAREATMLRLLHEALPARQRRISMGVQTFDPAWLARMGRAAFGTRDEIAALVQRAHDLGMTASCDLLVNLPGQPLTAMLDDVRTAVAMGFDQVCVYHLVLRAGLDAAWSRDEALLAQLPDNAIACAHWLAVRAALLDAGFVQSTLTNFERADVARDGRRFEYERASFHPELYDAVGFGPGGISCFSDPAHRRALKWVGEADSRAYAARIARGRDGASMQFAYDAEDLRLLYLTRKLALTRIPRETYRVRFGSDPVEKLGAEIDALVRAGLLRLEDDALVATPEGMFYADSIAGLLADRRADGLRAQIEDHDGHMG